MIVPPNAILLPLIRSPRKRYETLQPWGHRLWQECRPIEPGTPAATYLERRCCIVPPNDLRWHPALPYQVQRELVHVGPALVALVTDIDGEPINLHRTWIAADGSGKADLPDELTPRKVLWNHRFDGVIRLWPDEAITIGLVVGEGIETCLAAASIPGFTPVWAVLNATNLGAFPVLPGLEAITVLADHDRLNPKTGKRPGTEAALALIERYTKAGFDPIRDIRVVFPALEGQDANDLVMQWRGAA